MAFEATAEANVATRFEPRDLEAEDGLSITFLLLGVVLVMLLFRPGDLYKPLRILHLPFVFAITCLLSHAVNSLSQGRFVFALTPATKLVLAISVWGLITVPFAFWQFGSIRSFYNDWVKTVALFLLLGNALTSVKRMKVAAWICMLSSTAVSLIAIAMYVVYGSNDFKGRLIALVSGPYSGSNYFSITLLIMLPYALFAFFLEERMALRLLAGAIALTLSLANLMTESRAGFIGMVVIVVAVLWKLRRWGKSLRPTLTVIGLGTMLLLASPKTLWVRLSTLLNDYDVTQLDVTSPLRMAAGSSKERVRIIFKALTLTAEHPIVGVGMGNFSTASAHRFPTGIGRDWVGVHNSYLQFSSELGLPGLALYLGLLYVLFKNLREVKEAIPAEMLTHPETRELSILRDATVVSIIGYMLVSAFANVAYQVYLFIPAGIAQSIYLLALREPLTTPVREAVAQPPAFWVSPPTPWPSRVVK